MEKFLGNELSFKTYSWLRVNDTEINLPQILSNPYPMDSDTQEVIPVFEEKIYGIAPESVELNKKYGNVYRLYKTKTGEERKEKVTFFLNGQSNQLLDTEDLVAEEGSKLSVILDYSGEGAGKKFRSSLIRIWAKKNSEVHLFIVQNEDGETFSLESVFAQIEDRAKVYLHQYELGSKRFYSNFQGDLKGKASELTIDSIYFGYDDHELNMLYNIVHYGEESKSDIVVNGALKDRSYKNFKSTLDFKEGSAFSVGSEEEFALLLDDDVHALSVPVLLAHEDNVEGNHAASAGKLDQDLLFYIMSRGFSYEDAENLMIESKFSGAIDRLEDEEIKEKIRNRVHGIIRKRQ